MAQPPPRSAKAPLGPSRSLPSPCPRPPSPPRAKAPSRLRGARSLAQVAVALVALWAAAARGDASSTTLRFATQPPDRPLALYRAPAPYQRSGGRPLNSVIITSKPFSITQMSTTSAPSTSSSAAESDAGRASSSSPSAAGSAHAWRRVSSPTTQSPQVTLTLPQYSIDCAEGLSCSETIAVDAATPRPTFKPYPQDVLDKFLRDFAANAASRRPDDHADDHDRRQSSEDSAERPTNRLANLYLEHGAAASAAGDRGDDQEEIAGEGEREDEEREGEQSEGKSRWHLLSAQQHHHPYDDRDGWVSLEPVPWSTSKVAKWHATRTKRPEYKPPNRWDARPPLDWEKPSRPPWVRPSYEDDYEPPHRPSLSVWSSRPVHAPAPAHGDHRPWDAPAPAHHHGHDYEYQRPPHWPGAATAPHDIITDNRPNRWPDGAGGGGGGGGGGGYRPWENKKPHYDYSHGGGGGGGGSPRPYDTHRHPPSHPEESDGEWVLVSSTKGYAVPHRHRIFQRALAISAKPITSRRTVRLTVLPALNGTANTTISHGGLLEVESTFQSVEEEQQQQELQHHLQPHHRPPAHHYVPVHAPAPARPVYRPVQHQPPPPPPPSHQHPTISNDVKPLVEAVRPKARGVRLVAAQGAQDSSRAVLAAVGAGMVPATLALMAPLVLGRRRRRSPLPPPALALPTRAPHRLNTTSTTDRRRLNTRSAPAQH